MARKGPSTRWAAAMQRWCGHGQAPFTASNRPIPPACRSPRAGHHPSRMLLCPPRIEPACAGKAGEVLRMKESNDQGSANQIGPESCTTARKDGREALTGVRAGWLLQSRKHLPGADAHVGVRKATPAGSPRREPTGPGGAVEPRHARTHLAREGQAFPQEAGRSLLWPELSSGPHRESLTGARR